MYVKAQRWGNSLAVRIPKAVADEAGIREQDEMEIDVAGGIIRLRPRVLEPSLDELLAGVTPENLHGEADFGRPEGREAW
jgi:antitoxin MazE